jgi:hypothetical protein
MPNVNKYARHCRKCQDLFFSLIFIISMRRDILTISDAFIEPPSETMVFRTITMYCHDDFHLDILLHTTQDMKDLYYRFMKPRGLMDYIAGIIIETEFEEGIRIDTIGVYPRTIVAKSLRIENQMRILQQVRSLIEIE